MNQECYQGAHLSLYTPLGAVCVFVFCLGPPLGILLLMLHKSKHLSETQTRTVYGFLYHRFRAEYFFFESVKQLQMLMLVLVNVFSNAIYQYHQALLLLSVLLCIGIINMTCQALRAKLLVLLEYLSLMVLALSITLGLFFVDSSEAGSELGLDNQAAEIAIAAIILTLNAGLLLVLVLVIAWPALMRVCLRAKEALKKHRADKEAQQSSLSAEIEKQNYLRHAPSTA
ncbi:hypothetical protein HYH03_003325 [Edaphochlamys debaryana]|uniref:Uncharacterized protein n=1 Tax=Edaphochlamys debaryana TaxID=47281 RepID=A0A835YJ20_9CHLO|nr:hypothetical protein HYH03_003325 [Edaphochlamys debaryana]|eukprot:KAG2498574.1 hypothetical protein HYH03_003325 [Edaphochlamys debaryana]